LRKEKRRGKGNKLHIGRLLQMVLQDAQMRLFFKAQAMIQSEVRYHVPRLEDLRQPELLIGMPTNLKLDLFIIMIMIRDRPKKQDVV